MQSDLSLEIVDADVSNNAVSVEIMDAETSGVSVEIMGFKTRKSQIQPTSVRQQDASLITHADIGFGAIGFNTMPKHSARVPKLKQFPDYDSPGKSCDGGECPDAPSSPPGTPKPRTTSTPRIFPDETEDGTPGSPSLVAVCSNDSLDMYLPLSKALQFSPRNTPRKTDLPFSRAESTPSKDERSQVGNLLSKGPSPYKPHQTKNSSFHEKSWGELYPPDTASSTPKATSTTRICYADSEDGTPASPSLEAVCSNDSLDMYLPLSKALQVSPRKTPSKTQSPSRPSASGSTTSKNAPSKVSNPQSKEPSPCKYRRPKYVPSNVKTPKSKTTKRRIYHTESEDDRPAFANMEEVSSSDSVLIPTTVRNVLLVSPRNATSKTRRKAPSRSKPSKSKRQKTESADNGSGSSATPSKDGDPKNKGPSPYKPQRPKYLPKNVKLAKRKRKERENFLKEVEVFDAQLVKLPSAVSSKTVVNPVFTSEDNLLGTQNPVFVCFDPNNFFAAYDEVTFDTHFGVNVVELARRVKLSPHLATVKDYRDLTLFLSVTSDLTFFNIMSQYVEDDLIRKNYVLDWVDLKNILVNFGLSKNKLELDAAAYFGLGRPKSPKPWNFTFLFMVLEYSFPSYRKSHLMRLLNFLGGCLFDPLLRQCEFCIGTLIRRIAEHVILGYGATPDELEAALDRSSWIGNRVIVQILSPHPHLRTTARTMAYRTVHRILQTEYDPDRNTLSHVADMLADVDAIRTKTGVKDIYQLICMCEALVAMSPSPFDRETTAFLEKLADFAEHLSLGYTYFENLYFTDTLTRLRVLSSMTHF